MSSHLYSCPCIALAVLIGLQPCSPVYAQDTTTAHRSSILRQFLDTEPDVSKEHLIKLLREKVRYVFVIYQENRSFDSYFGTFPGAEGIFSHPPAETPGFDQELVDTNGNRGTIHPFRIGPKEYASDTDDN